MVFYKVYIFCVDQKFEMATNTGQSLAYLGPYTSKCIKSVFFLQTNCKYDYRNLRTIGRIAAFRLNFLGNTKIGRSIP